MPSKLGEYSIEFLLAAALTALCLILSFLYFMKKNRALPPGPWGLPYLGIAPFVDQKLPHLHFQRLSRRYGEVLSFTVTGHLYVHLGSIRAMREALVSKADCFAGRSGDYSIINGLFKDGIANLQDEPWRVLRKFFVQSFKECGLTTGRSGTSDAFQDCMESTVRELTASRGKPVDLAALFAAKCSTLMRETFFGRSGTTDEELAEIVQAYAPLPSGLGGINLLIVGKVAKYLILPLMPSYWSCVKSKKDLVAIFERIIRRREQALDENNARGVIDGYLKERNDLRRKGDPRAVYFTNDSLTSSLLQFVADGIISISAFVNLFVCCLLQHPEEGGKLFEEIADVVGTDRLPTLEDKGSLPYTNAFIQEVMRTTDFIPFFPTVQCTRETTLGGYRIPEGAILLPNYWAAHHDPATYEDPDRFDPSRFIARDGKPRAELPVVFGVGRRSCAGEGFAMAQAFLFLTVLVQKFRLSLPEGVDPKATLFIDAGAFHVMAEPRCPSKKDS